MQVPFSELKIEPRFVPPLDPGFLPASLFNRAYRELARQRGAVPLALVLERADGSVSRHDTIVAAAGTLSQELTNFTLNAS
jgi:hypothetical protein